MTRVAVVLFNLGGPDRPEAVRPFLFNLFNDPAIIGAPQPIRWLLAQLISRRRAPVARDIYARLGGASPLLANTVKQARALEQALAADATVEARCFIAMRYWYPMAQETVAAVKDWRPDTVTLLPLYPQYSTSTTASSVAAWREAAGRAGLDVPARTVCCYPAQDGLVKAIAARVRDGLRAAVKHGRPRVLFSAHGLPERIVRRGDPYAWQVERTAAAVAAELDGEDFEWVVCYQSRVGPLEWLRPYTEDELRRAGSDGVPLVVVPVSFVSEHSETLVELDMEYRERAAALGVPAYLRTPTVDDDPAFIDGLAALVRQALSSDTEVCSAAGGRTCPAAFGKCGFAGPTSGV